MKKKPKKTDDRGRVIMQVKRGNVSGKVLREMRPPKLEHLATRDANKTKRKPARKVRKVDDRMQLQIRVGARLIENLDCAVEWMNYFRCQAGEEENETRTSVGCRAIARRLKFADRSTGDTIPSDGWIPGQTTADVLVGNRMPLMLRVERTMMAEIIKACEEANTTRTVWVLDALLAELALVRSEAGGNAATGR